MRKESVAVPPICSVLVVSFQTCSLVSVDFWSAPTSLVPFSTPFDHSLSSVVLQLPMMLQRLRDESCNWLSCLMTPAVDLLFLGCQLLAKNQSPAHTRYPGASFWDPGQKLFGCASLRAIRALSNLLNRTQAFLLQLLRYLRSRRRFPLARLL